MEDVLDELGDFLESKKLNIKFNSENFVLDHLSDIDYRVSIILLCIQEIGKIKNERLTIDQRYLKLVQFYAINSSIVEELMLLISALREGGSYKRQYLPEAYLSDDIFDQTIRLLRIKGLVSYENENIVLTDKGSVGVERIKRLTELNNLFKVEMGIIEIMKSIKFTKKLLG